MPRFSRRITRWQRLPLKSPNKARIKDDEDAIAKNLVLPYNPHHPVVRYAAGMGAASRVHEFINRSVAAFAAVDQQGIERFIQSYGALAAVVSFLLMILQAIAAPLPAFLITFANASLFGAFWGGLLSWTSSMAGAVLFYRQSDGPRSGGKVNG